MDSEEEMLYEQALASDRQAAGRLAHRLDVGDAAFRRSLVQLAEATHFPEVVEPLVHSAHLTGDVDLLRRWSAFSDRVRELLPSAIANRDRLADVERRAADGDNRAGWELAVHRGLAKDRAGLRQLVADGNAVAAVLLSDLAFWEDDVDVLRELARTGLAVCVANFVQMAPAGEVEQLAVAGNVVAFLNRCQRLLDEGDTARLQQFVASMPDVPVWS